MTYRHTHVFPLAGPLDPYCALGCGKRRSQCEQELRDYLTDRKAKESASDR